MVEVFKTNVQQKKQANMLLTTISAHLPLFKVNFDLEDCDRILRVEGINISPEIIINLLREKGYQCEVL
ncbi:hypothetical protein MMC2321_03261 [Chitinophaga sp. MM2321]